MCGIAGIYNTRKQPTQEQLERMAQALYHRGPDGQGLHLNGPIGLAHRRLRIIDLHARADQPFASRDGALSLVFNGEIYNFQDLRKRLVDRGYAFRTESDTEVLLASYEEFGPQCLQELEGMFAFALWDKRKAQLFLARDPAGEKPLFYTLIPGGGLAFASEVKALLAAGGLGVERDPDAIAPFLAYGFAPSPGSFYRGVQKLPPGHSLTIGKAGLTTERYFRPRFNPRGPIPTYRDAQAELRARMRKIVRDRLVADVPLGAFLSGGLDSATVVGIATRDLNRQVHTYSIGFEDQAMNEAPLARKSAEYLGAIHTEFMVTPAEMPSVDELVLHHDGPFGDSSAIPTYLVSKLAREHVTVAVTGDGGDELFGGYPRMAAGMWAERIPAAARRAAKRGFVVADKLLEWRGSGSTYSLLDRASRFGQGMALDLPDRMLRWNSLFSVEEARALLNSPPPGEQLKHYHHRHFYEVANHPALSQIMQHNFCSYLPEDLLVKVDRCAMAVSLETRSPFLDSRLVQFAGSLPLSYRISGLTLKRIVRDTFGDLLAPELHKAPKRGFGVPLVKWLQGKKLDTMHSVLKSADSAIYEYLNHAEVQKLIYGSPKLSARTAQKAYQLWTLESWLTQDLGAVALEKARSQAASAA